MVVRLVSTVLRVFNTPWRVHLYIRNTKAAIKQRYPGHYLVIAGRRSSALALSHGARGSFGK